jgi:SAM-dependent methyltransferase
MLKIFDRQSRIDYWENYWAKVGRDPDHLTRDDIYPLYPTHKYIRTGMKILEVGCGLGRVVKHYNANNFQIIGFDYESQSVTNLHKQNPDLDLYVGDANHIPHKSNSFDAALVFGTLSNMEDPKVSLKEIWRILKPSGLLIASVTNDNIARRILEYLKEFKRESKSFSMMAYNVKEWEQVLQKEGFEVIEITPVVTRLPLHKFFPFLRKSGQYSTFHDNDQKLCLNSLGEQVFKMSYKYIPFSITHGLVGVAHKVAP